MAVVEHGFMLFSDAELDIGIKYAAEKDHISINFGRLRTIANNAGKNLHNVEEKITPREATFRATRAFEREFPGVKFSDKVFNAYVHAIAKMFSERNPKTRVKRQIETERNEILEASHDVESSKPIDPEVNREISALLL